MQYEKEKEEEETKKKKRKLKKEENNMKNVSIPKGIDIKSIDLERAKYLCSLPLSLGKNPENDKDITVNVGRFGPYLKCENKSARLENVEEIFSIGLNRAVTLIAEAKPGRISSSLIKDLGEHPEDKKPVRIMKGQYGPYIKYKSLNATIPEEKDPIELTMEEALILIEKRKEYDKNDGKLIKGKVGKDFNTEQAYKAAQRCALNIIAQAKKACSDDLSRIKSCIKLTGFVNSTDDFIEQPKVVNGASDLIKDVFGDNGTHTRAAVSTNSLPLGVAVEVDAIFEIK